MMNICIFLLESDFKEDNFDNDVLMIMLDTNDSSYALDLESIQTAQMVDEGLT